MRSLPSFQSISPCVKADDRRCVNYISLGSKRSMIERSETDGAVFHGKFAWNNVISVSMNSNDAFTSAGFRTIDHFSRSDTLYRQPFN